MLRFVPVAGVLAVLVLGVAVGPAAADEPCAPTGAPLTGQMLPSPPTLPADSLVLFGIRGLDPDNVVDGSVVVTLTGPNGAVPVTFVPEHGWEARPPTPGAYTVEAHWTVRTCIGANGSFETAPASAPAARLTVTPRDAKPRARFFGMPKAEGTLRPNRRSEQLAYIAGTFDCPDPEKSYDRPITITVRTSTSRPPTTESPKVSQRYHCPPHRVTGPLRRHPWGFTYVSSQTIAADAKFGRTLHVWIEITWGDETIGAIRVVMRPAGPSRMTMAIDRGQACTITCSPSWQKG